MNERKREEGWAEEDIIYGYLYGSSMSGVVIDALSNGVRRDHALQWWLRSSEPLGLAHYALLFEQGTRNTA